MAIFSIKILLILFIFVDVRLKAIKTIRTIKRPSFNETIFAPYGSIPTADVYESNDGTVNGFSSQKSKKLLNKLNIINKAELNFAKDRKLSNYSATNQVSSNHFQNDLVESIQKIGPISNLAFDLARSKNVSIVSGSIEQKWSHKQNESRSAMKSLMLEKKKAIIPKSTGNQSIVSSQSSTSSASDAIDGLNDQRSPSDVKDNDHHYRNKSFKISNNVDLNHPYRLKHQTSVDFNRDREVSDNFEDVNDEADDDVDDAKREKININRQQQQQQRQQEKTNLPQIDSFRLRNRSIVESKRRNSNESNQFEWNKLQSSKKEAMSESDVEINSINDENNNEKNNSIIFPFKMSSFSSPTPSSSSSSSSHNDRINLYDSNSYDTTNIIATIITSFNSSNDSNNNNNDNDNDNKSFRSIMERKKLNQNRINDLENVSVDVGVGVGVGVGGVHSIANKNRTETNANRIFSLQNENQINERRLEKENYYDSNHDDGDSDGGDVKKRINEDKNEINFERGKKSRTKKIEKKISRKKSEKIWPIISPSLSLSSFSSPLLSSSSSLSSLQSVTKFDDDDDDDDEMMIERNVANESISSRSSSHSSSISFPPPTSFFSSLSINFSSLVLSSNSQPSFVSFLASNNSIDSDAKRTKLVTSNTTSYAITSNHSTNTNLNNQFYIQNLSSLIPEQSNELEKNDEKDLMSIEKEDYRQQQHQQQRHNETSNIEIDFEHRDRSLSSSSSSSSSLFWLPSNSSNDSYTNRFEINGSIFSPPELNSNDRESRIISSILLETNKSSTPSPSEPEANYNLSGDHHTRSDHSDYNKSNDGEYDAREVPKIKVIKYKLSNENLSIEMRSVRNQTDQTESVTRLNQNQTILAKDENNGEQNRTEEFDKYSSKNLLEARSGIRSNHKDLMISFNDQNDTTMMMMMIKNQSKTSKDIANFSDNNIDRTSTISSFEYDGKENSMVNRKHFCPKEIDANGIFWPRTDAGILSVQPCPMKQYYGTMFRLCHSDHLTSSINAIVKQENNNSIYWLKPDLSECRLLKLRELHYLIEQHQRKHLIDGLFLLIIELKNLIHKQTIYNQFDLKESIQMLNGVLNHLSEHRIRFDRAHPDQQTNLIRFIQSVILLSDHFLEQINQNQYKNFEIVTSELIQLIQSIRSLLDNVFRAFILACQEDSLKYFDDIFKVQPLIPYTNNLEIRLSYQPRYDLLESRDLISLISSNQSIDCDQICSTLMNDGDRSTSNNKATIFENIISILAFKGTNEFGFGLTEIVMKNLDGPSYDHHHQQHHHSRHRYRVNSIKSTLTDQIRQKRKQSSVISDQILAISIVPIVSLKVNLVSTPQYEVIFPIDYQSLMSIEGDSNEIKRFDSIELNNPSLSSSSSSSTSSYSILLNRGENETINSSFGNQIEIDNNNDEDDGIDEESLNGIFEENFAEKMPSKTFEHHRFLSKRIDSSDNLFSTMPFYYDEKIHSFESSQRSSDETIQCSRLVLSSHRKSSIRSVASGNDCKTINFNGTHLRCLCDETGLIGAIVVHRPISILESFESTDYQDEFSSLSFQSKSKTSIASRIIRSSGFHLVAGTMAPSSHYLLYDITLYTSLISSVLFYSITLILQYRFRHYETVETYFIIRNLLISLLLIQLIFLLGTTIHMDLFWIRVEQLSTIFQPNTWSNYLKHILCLSVPIFLHFIHLASMFWMVSHTILLYQRMWRRCSKNSSERNPTQIDHQSIVKTSQLNRTKISNNEREIMKDRLNLNELGASSQKYRQRYLKKIQNHWSDQIVFDHHRHRHHRHQRHQKNILSKEKKKKKKKKIKSFRANSFSRLIEMIKQKFHHGTLLGFDRKSIKNIKDDYHRESSQHQTNDRQHSTSLTFDEVNQPKNFSETIQNYFDHHHHHHHLSQHHYQYFPFDEQLKNSIGKDLSTATSISTSTSKSSITERARAKRRSKLVERIFTQKLRMMNDDGDQSLIKVNGFNDSGNESNRSQQNDDGGTERILCPHKDYDCNNNNDDDDDGDDDSVRDQNSIINRTKRFVSKRMQNSFPSSDCCLVNVLQFIKSIFKQWNCAHFLLLSMILPFVLVLASYLLNSKGYETKRYCWMSIEGGIQYSFIAPVLLLIPLNTILILLVLRRFFQRKSLSNRIQIEQIRPSIRACIILLPFFTLNWFLGILSLETLRTTPFEMIFALTNGLHSFLAFYFYCFQRYDLKHLLIKHGDGPLKCLSTSSSSSSLPYLNRKESGWLRFITKQFLSPKWLLFFKKTSKLSFDDDDNGNNHNDDDGDNGDCDNDNDDLGLGFDQSGNEKTTIDLLPKNVSLPSNSHHHHYHSRLYHQHELHHCVEDLQHRNDIHRKSDGKREYSPKSCTNREISHIQNHEKHNVCCCNDELIQSIIQDNDSSRRNNITRFDSIEANEFPSISQFQSRFDCQNSDCICCCCNLNDFKNIDLQLPSKLMNWEDSRDSKTDKTDADDQCHLRIDKSNKISFNEATVCDNCTQIISLPNHKIDDYLCSSNHRTSNVNDEKEDECKQNDNQCKRLTKIDFNLPTPTIDDTNSLIIAEDLEEVDDDNDDLIIIEIDNEDDSEVEDDDDEDDDDEIDSDEILVETDDYFNELHRNFHCDM